MAFNTGLTEREVRVTSGVNTDGLRLQIEDESSATLLAEINLTPELIWELLRGGTFKRHAQTASDLSNVGKTMEVEFIDVPKDKLSHVSYDEHLDAARAWAKFYHPGWESYFARRNSGGRVTVVARKWVA